MARRRVELGQASYLSLLNAQQTYQQARINLVQAQASRFADTAALFQALAAAGGTAPTSRPKKASFAAASDRAP
ncbi:MAG TPA: TolC family protein [Stellaceae bacterium]